MNRRNFLAFIPTLSAIPFVSKAIEKTDSGIFIPSPKPAIISDLSRSPIDSFYDLEVRLYAHGKHVGNAYISELTMHNPLIETTCRDHDGYNHYVQGSQEINMTCIVSNPQQLIENIV